ncbi:MAG: response regulator [Anaerolineae bacterium]|nr:response regulator [Anaerolineae bacterium]
MILSQTIEEAGWYWRVVTDGDEAIQVMDRQARKFNLALLDLRLGDAEVAAGEGLGWRFLDYLSKHDPNIKVIIVSGEASRTDVANLFMKHAISGFIDKDTFDRSQLLTLIQDILAGPQLQIQTLGGFALWRDNQLVDMFGHPLAETFLKILITRRGEPTTLDELRDLLNLDSDAREASATLRSIANATCLALEPGLVDPYDSSFIIRTGSAYYFNTAAQVNLDIEELDRILLEGQHHEREGAFVRAIRTYERSLALYQGEYLPQDRSARWTVATRNALQTQFVQILNRLADVYARDQRLEDAISAAQFSLQQDAYHESTYRRLMRYYACHGNLKPLCAFIIP